MFRSIGSRATMTLLLGILALGVACTKAPVPTPRYGFDVSVAPSADGAGTFETLVTIRDLASGKTVFQPKVLAAAGEPATVDATDSESGVSFLITVEIGSGGNMASYHAEVRDVGGVITVHDARIRLQTS